MAKYKLKDKDKKIVTVEETVEKEIDLAHLERTITSREKDLEKETKILNELKERRDAILKDVDFD